MRGIDSARETNTQTKNRRRRPATSHFQCFDERGPWPTRPSDANPVCPSIRDEVRARFALSEEQGEFIVLPGCLWRAQRCAPTRARPFGKIRKRGEG